MNTLSYNWGPARLSACVEHAVHIDNDIHLLPSPLSPSPRKWVASALAVLRENPQVMSVHPTTLHTLAGRQQKDPNCEWIEAYGHCACSAPENPKVFGNLFQSSHALLLHRAHVCGYTLGGVHEAVSHFTCQAWVMAIDRFLSMWPFADAKSHVETLFEVAGKRAQVVPIYLSSSVLGVGQLHHANPLTGSPNNVAKKSRREDDAIREVVRKQAEVAAALAISSNLARSSDLA